MKRTLWSAPLLAFAITSAQAATPADLLAGYAAQAGGTPQADRGQQFFTSRHARIPS
jgi:hypothetical protein